MTLLDRVRHAGGAAPGSPDPEDDARMSLMEHLQALRRALIISVAAWLVATAVSLIFAGTILGFLKQRAGLPHLYSTSLTGGFGAAIQVALYLGLIGSAPVLIHQAWWFVSPGLHRRERRVALPMLVATIFFFFLGVGFALVALSYIGRILLQFQSGMGIDAIPTADQFLDFLLALIIGFGLVFELPVVLYVLGIMGIISSRWLYKNRAYWWLGMGLLSQFLIPGSDPFTPFILFIPLLVFWEATALLLKLTGR